MGLVRSYVRVGLGLVAAAVLALVGSFVGSLSGVSGSLAVVVGAVAVVVTVLVVLAARAATR